MIQNYRFVVALMWLAVGAGCRNADLKPEITATSVSPDMKTRIDLVEIPERFDRNFNLVVREYPDMNPRIIFQSPDEGRPAGSERFVWSSTGHRVLLLGKHFFVPAEDIRANKYDLSINRYSETVYEEEEYDPPKEILARMMTLEKDIMADMEELRGILE